MRPGRLPHRVGSNVAQRGLWAPGQRVAVAVSGGLDSCVLLQLLIDTLRWHGASLSVVTVDHGTRKDSASHADFVETLARAAQLPCERFSLHLGEGASEAACRDARYACLAAVNADVVALAHHRDDQAETVLINLMRGTGPRGLAGMSWKRGRYARPLLDVPRSEIDAWASARGLSWVEDPSNTDPRFLRNRVRHELLPLIESIRPGSTAAIARSAGAMAAWLGASVSELVENAHDGS
jgi:tRNA(Ile)-lysidine synthase